MVRDTLHVSSGTRYVLHYCAYRTWVQYTGHWPPYAIILFTSLVTQDRTVIGAGHSNPIECARMASTFTWSSLLLTSSNTVKPSPAIFAGEPTSFYPFTYYHIAVYTVETRCAFRDTMPGCNSVSLRFTIHRIGYGLGTRYTISHTTLL